MRKAYHRSIRGFVTLALGLACICVNAEADDPFPRVAPAEVGVSAEAIELLSDYVGGLIESEAAIGAEVHVIKDRRTVFRRAYGWADREAQRALETNAVYCVRSMTKPLVGTAIQMLIDDGKLSLDQHVGEFLSEFDQPDLREITIEHLLTHTSGLPLTVIQKPLSEYRTLRDVAGDAAKAGIDFKPGTSFQYSDAGSDTLGAIVATVSGQPAEDFIRDRILKPMAMEETLTLLLNDARRDRIPSAYSGGAGDWQRHWKPTEQPIFPIFLTSQSLYCTTTDYARFITLWMDGGVHGGRRLLSKEAASRALSPGRPIREYPTGFEGLTLSYGQQWMVYHNEDSQQPIVFGHNGSDGTHVWAWPDQDLIVLFFTQSRGTLAGVELEATIHRLLISQDIDGYRREHLAAETAKESLQPYAGIYWDEDVDDAYYVVLVEKDKLVMERPGRLCAVAKPTQEKGKFVIGSSLKLEFESETNPATAMLMTMKQRTERQVRHKPDDGLPAVNDVIAQVATAHGIHAMKDAGIIKLSGTIQMGLFGAKGKIQTWFDSRNSRTEINIGPTPVVVVTNGDEVAATGMSGSFKRMKGTSRRQELLGHPAIEYGGWRRGYEQVEVLKHIEAKKLLLVRATARNVPGVTLYVDTETNRVKGANRIQFVPGMGFVGVQSQYGDFREVGGVTLPFKIESKHANPLIGKMIISFNEGESGISGSNLFDLPSD